MFDTGTGVAIPASADFLYAAREAGGGWLYYEVAMTPFEFFGGLYSPAQANVPTTLLAGEIVGVDVCIVGNAGGTYSGMRSENAMTGQV